jgi:hypothetical protein
MVGFWLSEQGSKRAREFLNAAGGACARRVEPSFPLQPKEAFERILEIGPLFATSYFDPHFDLPAMEDFQVPLL